MDFKIVNKNKIGVITTLLLLILLSQSRIFEFLFNTYLGRITLIIFILVISNCHKIFGVIAIFFIIIMYNKNHFLEGLQNNTPNKINNNTKNVIPNIPMNNTLEKKNKPSKGIEGFNMIEREHKILQGKQSNSVPTSLSRNQNEDIEPSDKSVFSGSYSSV
jgi:esterase/lipase